jgi:hypothetical protein
MHYEFIPYKKDLACDLGGYHDGTLYEARQAAYLLLCSYGYSHVDIVCNGEVVATV